jgi:hypothetical protein
VVSVFRVDIGLVSQKELDYVWMAIKGCYVQWRVETIGVLAEHEIGLLFEQHLDLFQITFGAALWNALILFIKGSRFHKRLSWFWSFVKGSVPIVIFSMQNHFVTPVQFSRPQPALKQSGLTRMAVR